MKKISGIDLVGQELTEWTPGYAKDFPHAVYLCQLENHNAKYACDQSKIGGASWHWFGKAAGLFFVKEGAFAFTTAAGKTVFEKGQGGFMNVNVLHSLKLPEGVDQAQVMVHLFDPEILIGDSGGRISQKYIQPILNDRKLELVMITKDDPEMRVLYKELLESFSLDEEAVDYEIRIRNMLSGMWTDLFDMVEPGLGQQKKENRADEKVKRMMVYVYQHFDEKITVADIASSAFVSIRECFRIFNSSLGTTPERFVRDYRLRMACQMLSSTTDSVTTIGYNCGFRNNSYFCKIFRENLGISPLAFRKKSKA
ncbi:MAG: helix-turn-helix transcriptional regulator [Firmicutes bacterium]|nr:helix-turn-helix transcriptional regulator [Bacillota bacterium]